MKTILLILATFAALSACCLVLVGGCEKKTEIDPNAIAKEDTNYTLTRSEAMAMFAEASRDSILPIQFASDTNIIPQPYQPDSCPPCPDSLSMQSRIIITRMPPGRWVTSKFFCYWCDLSEALETWPDSVFILSEKE